MVTLVKATHSLACTKLASNHLQCSGIIQIGEELFKSPARFFCDKKWATIPQSNTFLL